MDIPVKKTRKDIARKYAPWALGALLLATLILLPPSSLLLPSSLKVDPRTITIAQVKNQQFNDYVSIHAQVAPIQVIQISTQEGGIVQKQVAQEGAHVQKGDILVTLHNPNLHLQILNAESQLAEKQNMLRNTQITMQQDRLNNLNEQLSLEIDEQRKQREFNQQKQLYQEQLTTRDDYLKAQEDYQLAKRKHQLILQRLAQDHKYRKAQIQQMQQNLHTMQRNLQLIHQRKQQLNIRAQISGQVGPLDVELGQNIAPGQKIGVINDLSDYKVQAKIDEHYIDRVHQGLTATFQHPAANSQHSATYTLQVRKVYPEVREGRFKVDLVFSGQRPNNIRTGQTYYIDLQLGESKKAILIPKGTFYSVTGGQWIFVLDKDCKRAYRRNIRIGRQNPQYYEVLEGLQPGEQVIISGYEAYKDHQILKLQ